MERRSFLTGTGAACAALAVGSVAPFGGRAPGLASLSGATMGTYFRILVPDTATDTETLRLTATETLAEVDRLMSTYRVDSEVSRFNAAGIQTPVSISSHTGTVLDAARRIGALTGGAFDATVGPLVALWGFGAAGRPGAVPGPGLVAETARQVGMDALRTDRRAAWKTRPDLAIDLNGIAKGYAVDRLATLLDAQGVPAYLVDIGGELRAKGRRSDGRPWQVGIERPTPGQRAVHRVVALQDKAIATSGDYRDYFTQAGRNYTHVIDPRTAHPVRHRLASVTVLARDTMTADALSTALMVMGPDEGPVFADRNGIAAYFLQRDDGRLVARVTAAFQPWIAAAA